MPILSEYLEKKLNASDQKDREQEPYPNDGQCRPARVVAHTTYSLYELRNETSGGNRPR